MEVIAKTETGYLITASENEIKEILNSVTGTRPSDIKIGQKIPAIDYASTITKVKQINKTSAYTQLMSYADSFADNIATLKEHVEKASTIEI